jgi:hypothetical protein
LYFWRETVARSLGIRPAARLKRSFESLFKRLTNGRHRTQKENPDRIERSGFGVTVFSFSRPA